MDKLQFSHTIFIHIYVTDHPNPLTCILDQFYLMQLLIGLDYFARYFPLNTHFKNSFSYFRQP
jgi:hypothetical protein